MSMQYGPGSMQGSGSFQSPKPQGPGLMAKIDSVQTSLGSLTALVNELEKKLEPLVPQVPSAAASGATATSTKPVQSAALDKLDDVLLCLAVLQCRVTSLTQRVEC